MQETKHDTYTHGGRTCSGCAIPLIINNVLSQAENPVVAIATSCMEVSSTIYPFNAWNVPCIHNAFENVASTITGVETAFRYKQKRGGLDKNQKNVQFLAFAGDGGSYDIGLQAISGAFERGHNFTLIVYDNEGYQNTGNQRSSATTPGASTTTTPFGKTENKKNLAEILVAHDSPYIAQSAAFYWKDIRQKARKAIETKGPTALIILAPCPTMWGFSPEKSKNIAKLAVETGYWPMYEVENRKYTLSTPPQKKPIEEFLATQKRFSSLIQDKQKIHGWQKNINASWKILSEKSKNNFA